MEMDETLWQAATGGGGGRGGGAVSSHCRRAVSRSDCVRILPVASSADVL